MTDARRSPLILVLLVILATGPGASAARAQDAVPLPLLEVRLDHPGDFDRFAPLGLDVIAARPGAWVRVLGWPGSAEAIAAAGFSAGVIDPDYPRTLADRSRADGSFRAFGRGTLAPLSVPQPGSGSLGGFYTLAEVNALLDSLAASDTLGIVAGPDSIGASLQGRAIRALRIADESQGDHTRPRVLLTSLTHAREPGGMQTLVRFMERLIAGYGTDPNLTYLVDHREIWFVPVVNPDGYEYNRQIWQNTGNFGMWRKNLRDNNGSGTITSVDGVDLNRNFGFQWGFNGSGSSGTPSSETYRGTGPFSEPETQVLRNFVNLHAFATANNYHTYAELCLYPWGYNGTDCPDATFYIRLAEEMMRDPAYAYGVPADILYPVNGDANDWMYGDQLQKPKVLAVTTEVGDQTDGFWPPPSRIVPLAALQDHSNDVLAYAAGTFARADSTWFTGGDGYLHPGLSADVAVRLRNMGILDTDGAVTVTASTAAAGITVADPQASYPAIPAGTTADPVDPFTISASPAVAAGTVVPVAIRIEDAGDYVYVDTVRVIVGEPVTVFHDDASAGLGNWTATNGWGTEVVGSDTVFSDSPGGNYTAGTDRSLTLTAPLDLSGGNAAFLTFRQTYDIEGGYDAGFVQVSTNGVNWTSLAGRMTRPGHGTSGAYSGGKQPLGEPCYDATQRIEATETIDLSAYAGLTDVRLRFRLQADSGLQRDGWKVDDVTVDVYPVDVSAVAEIAPPARPRVVLSPAWPNPSSAGAHVSASFAEPTPFTAAVYGVDGRLVRTVSQGIADGDRDFFWDGRTVDGGNAASGRYYLRVSWSGGAETVGLIRVR